MAHMVWDRSARVCEILFGPPLDSKVATPCRDFSHLSSTMLESVYCCRSGAPSLTKNKKQWDDGEMELTFGINGNGA
jgi:hypothetical protein